MEDNDIDTTVRLKKSTRERLEGIGKKGETYDELVNKLIDVFKECEFEEELEKKGR